MSSTLQTRRFPPPWTVVRDGPDAFFVQDANGIPLVYVPCCDDLQGVRYAHSRLTSDEARRIANGVARLPEFMMQRKGFYPRGGGDFRWRASRPYHVALNDLFIREHWGFITAVCRMNSIPFDPTGQRIDRDGHWYVYEFTEQLAAIQFWDRFEGRWLRGEEFMYPDRPLDLPKLREPAGIPKFNKPRAER